MKVKEIQYIDPNLFAPKDAWDRLSLREKAEMMKVAVRNGITSLQEIRQEYNEFAEGGGIHIKPENRGKFTALKERTGHSATWFKEHGSPEQKKMATFALNARKWKHGDGGNLFYPGGEIKYGRPYYSYDENGRKIDDTLNYNASLPEVTIIPDSQKSPAERNEDERYRQRFLRDYAQQQSRDYTARQVIQAQREWENSPEKKALDFGIAAAQGIGMASDVTSSLFGGIPVYSGLKGAQALDRATLSGNLEDYAESALWLSPMLTVGGKRIYDAAKPAVQSLFRKGTPAAEWTGLESNSGNVTDNLLKWLGRPEGYKPEKPISQENSLYFDFKPVQGEMAHIWKDKGVNLDRISGNDIEEALKKRWDELISSRQDRHTIVRSAGNGTYFLHDIIPDENAIYGWRSIGTTQLNKDASGNMHMADINNNTGSVRMGKPATEHGVQEKALNAAIRVANQEGGEGVVTGEWWLSAPKQQHIVQKYHDREVIGNTGQHSNTNMVEERINADIKRGLPVTGENETLAKSMLDLRRAGDKEIKTLFNQPFWLLRTPTYDVQVKSTLFDPTIIDRFGKMHIDWSNPDILKGLVYPTIIGSGIYGTQE